MQAAAAAALTDAGTAGAEGPWPSLPQEVQGARSLSQPTARVAESGSEPKPRTLPAAAGLQELCSHPTTSETWAQNAAG